MSKNCFDHQGFDIMELTLDTIRFISTAGRNRIVFCREPVNGLKFINVGYELAQSIMDNGKRHIDDAVNSVLGTTFLDDRIGNYIALKNIAILFEPELRLNLFNIFDRLSKNQTLFICSDGKIIEGKFHLIDASSPYCVDLTGLAFTLNRN